MRKAALTNKYNYCRDCGKPILCTDYRLKSGEKEPMHSHPSGVIVYYFTEAKMRATLPDGKTAETMNRAGDVIWRDPVTHFGENIGSSEVHALLVEPKVSYKGPAVPVSTPGARSTPPGVAMPASLEPHHHLRYENQYVRVLEVTLEPGESSLFHTHSLDVLYVTLSDAVVRAQLQGEDWGTETTFRTGDASFANASKAPFTHRLKKRRKSKVPYHQHRILALTEPSRAYC